MRVVRLSTDDPELWAHLRCVLLPSGIGEFQWAWTKFHNVRERFAVFALDGAPRRLHQFAELHPQIEVFGWSGFDYSQIREFQKWHGLDTWAAVTGNFGPGQIAQLACNPHLETGLPLASWLPDLPTTYTYPIETTVKHHQEAVRVLYGAEPEDILLGVSCASYRGAAAWHTWDAVGWTRYLQLVQALLPRAKFVLLGGSWDDITSAVFDTASGLRFQVDARGIPPVGTTTFGGAIEVMRALAGYIGFSSGLGHVAAHLCGCPVAMLWPDHEALLSTSWVNPELLKNGTYIPLPWVSPEEVFERTESWLLQRKAEVSYSLR
jgi:hypothetical protein